MQDRLKTLWPALVTLVVTSLYVLWRLSAAGMDPAALAEIGPRYAELDPQGDPGYDGQFSYFIAMDPRPSGVEGHLDVPAYRYQRILYPLLVRMLSLGDARVIPWMLIIFNLAFHALATWALAEYFWRLKLWTGYALVYGLWVGLVASAGLDMSEPLAYGLVVLGWLAWQRGRTVLGAALIVMALFAKETTILFWAAAILAALQSRTFGKKVAVLVTGGGFFLAWQIWLAGVFGQVGIGSGGEMATGFEWIPFLGFLKIGSESLRVLALYAVIFIPSIILPAIWGLISPIRAMLEGWRGGEAWALLLSSALVVFLPFSTFREPLALVRVASGLVLGVLLYAGIRSLKRPLNYSLFWIPMLVLLVSR
jgi:hypothetical protein